AFIVNMGVPEVAGCTILIGRVNQSNVPWNEDLVLENQGRLVSTEFGDGQSGGSFHSVIAEHIAGCQAGIGIDAGDAKRVVVVPHQPSALLVWIPVVGYSGRFSFGFLR